MSATSRMIVEFHDGTQVKVDFGHDHKAKMFVWGADNPAPAPKTSVKGENAELDAAWRAYNRQEIKLQREAVLLVADALVEQWAQGTLEHMLGHAVAHAKFAFSRNAGCSSCPCSPGFAFGDRLVLDGRHVQDIFITVKSPAAGR